MHADTHARHTLLTSGHGVYCAHLWHCHNRILSLSLSHKHLFVFLPLWGVSLTKCINPIRSSTLKPSLNLQTHQWCYGDQRKCPHFAGKICIPVLTMQVHTDTHPHTKGWRNWSLSKCLFNSHTPGLLQSMYAYEDTNTRACTHTQTSYHRHCWRERVSSYTQVKIAPVSGLRELTKRENPGDISSPLQSTHNDARIDLPMEMSSRWHTHTHKSTQNCRKCMHKHKYTQTKDVHTYDRVNCLC